MNIAKNMEAIFLSVAIASLAVVSMVNVDSASLEAPAASVATAPASVPATTTVAPAQV